MDLAADLPADLPVDLDFKAAEVFAAGFLFRHCAPSIPDTHQRRRYFRMPGMDTAGVPGAITWSMCYLRYLPALPVPPQPLSVSLRMAALASGSRTVTCLFAMHQEQCTRHMVHPLAGETG